MNASPSRNVSRFSRLFSTRAIVLALCVWVLTLSNSGCSTRGEPNPPNRPLRDWMMTGPESIRSPFARYAWHTSMGMFTTVIWSPWILYDYARHGGFVIRNIPSNDWQGGISHKGMTAVAAGPPDPWDIEFGAYHAIVIGNDDYAEFPNLRTGLSDARAVSATLDDQYGFSVRTLTNATRADVFEALHAARELGPQDNLLIFYAGHGYRDSESAEGYWLPVDASRSNSANWISNQDIKAAIRALKVKHVLLIVDSCFAGTLTRAAEPRLFNPAIVRLVRKKSRGVITSGGIEPVQDGSGGMHSVFAKYLLEVLDENQWILDASTLFLELRNNVIVNANQTPEFQVLRETGHDGGDFIFVRRSILKAESR